MDALDTLQRQIEGCLRKVQTAGRYNEISEEFCLAFSNYLIEARDLCIQERRATGLEASDLPKEPVITIREAA